jgi:hypothetical protein
MRGKIALIFLWLAVWQFLSVTLLLDVAWIFSGATPTPRSGTEKSKNLLAIGPQKITASRVRFNWAVESLRAKTA